MFLFFVVGDVFAEAAGPLEEIAEGGGDAVDVFDASFVVAEVGLFGG